VLTPLELTLDLQPRSRFDVIDVRRLVTDQFGDALDAYRRCLYCSFHTTAGYLDQSLASRLNQRRDGLTRYVETFRTMFPEGARYRHDNLDQRAELSAEQREVEPRNADSHLTFMASGLSTCANYLNRPGEAVDFVDLDGVCEGRPRHRTTSVVGYNEEAEVWRTRLAVPVSGHPVDSINLRDPALGLYEQVADLANRHGVAKGRVRLELVGAERHAGLTVNEYETLLMRYDLRDVLRSPLRFAVEKGVHAWQDPRAIPSKTLGYAQYDLVRTLNQLVEALGLNESLIERMFARLIAGPAARVLRMKRSVNVLVSDRQTPGRAAIVQGTYQSPILVQWRRATGGVRHVDVTLYRFL
jgi:thiamine phosphate synthase YjbQ (UPF0047 family)